MSSCPSIEARPSESAASCSFYPIGSGCPRMRRARRLGLTFGCARNPLPFLFIILTIIMSLWVGLGFLLLGAEDSNIRYTSWRFRDGSLRKVMMSIWVRSLPLPRSLGYSPSSRRRLRLGKGQPLICFLRFGWYDIAGHGRRRTIPQ